jgi:hypothetical protein
VQPEAQGLRFAASDWTRTFGDGARLSPEKLEPIAGFIRIKQPSPLNAWELEEVLEGQDAVLSAFGPRVPIAKKDATLLRNLRNGPDDCDGAR